MVLSQLLEMFWLHTVLLICILGNIQKILGGHLVSAMSMTICAVNTVCSRVVSTDENFSS